MAVYTHFGAEALACTLAEYDVGTLVSVKGIAEGVSNSNWLVDTDGRGAGLAHGTGARFILTMFEGRTDVADLPFFLGLLDHLAARGCPVPRTIHDRAGASFRMVGGKAVTLIEFLPGVSVSQPRPAQARAVGEALARVHLASADFAMARPNTMGRAAWAQLFASCGTQGLAAIDPALAPLVAREMAEVTASWPAHLPAGVIHADLFPDNVLMLGDSVSGLIDFYFAASDLYAYDVAVTHAAWCFDASGAGFDADLGRALLAGYESVRQLSADERAALPLLGRAAALRFLATRAWDWLNTPADALVTRKDPMAFARRLEFYAQAGASAFS